MKLLITLCTFLLLITGSGSKVYVCDSPSAVAYHATDKCWGLQKCTHVIVIMTLGDAEEKGLRACKVCY